jgi:hypothetical protein
VKDALATHRRLVAAGLSSDQARSSFVRLVTEAEAGRFDRVEVHKLIGGAGYSTAHVAFLIEELLERLARHAGGTSP